MNRFKLNALYLVANFTKFQVLGLIVQLVQCTTRKSYLSDLSRRTTLIP